ncbi:hypothetical protein GEMRC1_004801 [Eukaryota sp. GEM-RC1]
MSLRFVVFCVLGLCVNLVYTSDLTIDKDTILPSHSQFNNVVWNSGSLAVSDLKITGTLYLSAGSSVKLSGEVFANSVVVDGRVDLLSNANVSVVHTSDLSIESRSCLASTVPFTVSNQITVTLGFLSIDTTEYALSP